MENDQSARLLAIPDAAHYLGTTIWAVRQLVWKKKLRAVKLGKRFLLDKVELDAFIEALKAEAA